MSKLLGENGNFNENIQKAIHNFRNWPIAPKEGVGPKHPTEHLSFAAHSSVS